MASEVTVDKSGYQNKMAFVVGFTGETGKELVKELLQRKVFQKLILIGRRQVQLDGELYKDAEQRVIDFDHLDQHKSAFENCKVGFCCLGTTRAKSGPDGFVKIDHDYVVDMAKLAHEQGCEHFSVVSAMGADKNSRLLYPKTKGLMEQHVAEVGFTRFTIFRPAMILSDRPERTFSYKLINLCLQPVYWAMPTRFSVPANTLAQAMINDLGRKTPNKVDIFENAAIHQLAKEA